MGPPVAGPYVQKMGVVHQVRKFLIRYKMPLTRRKSVQYIIRSVKVDIFRKIIEGAVPEHFKGLARISPDAFLEGIEYTLECSCIQANFLPEILSKSFPSVSNLHISQRIVVRYIIPQGSITQF